MRLIDADALSAFVGDLRSTLHKEQSTFKAMTPIEFDTRDNMLLNFQYTIDNAPTVEIPQGEWIPNYTSQFRNPGRHCSLCGKVVEFSENFCPNCGAYMRGDEHD